MHTAIWVQRLGTPGTADVVTDAGVYCGLCALEGLRRFILDDQQATTLRFGHITIGASDDATRCAGCSIELASGLRSRDVQARDIAAWLDARRDSES